MPAMSQIMTLKDFFGFHPGQTLKEFSDECKKLTEAEKSSLANAAKAEMIRRGTHTAESFAF